MREITGIELVTDGLPKGWIITSRDQTRDVYFLEQDTPTHFAVEKLEALQRIATEALEALNGVTDEGPW